MPVQLFILILALLAALGSPLAAQESPGPGPGDDKPYLGGTPRLEDAAKRLEHAVERYAEIQAKFGAQSTPEAATLNDAIQNLIGQARQALANGNTMMVMGMCDMLERRIGELNMLGGKTATERFRSGPGPYGFDSLRLQQDQKIGAEWEIQRVAERLAWVSQRLELSKNPQAAALIEKIRTLIESARRESEAGRFQNVRPMLAQAESLLPELQRLIQENVSSDKGNLSGTGHDPFKDRQPGEQAALAQAWELYRRVYNGAVRLSERPVEASDAKAAALRTRVFDLLEKAKEALATSKAEAAKEYGLKAEGQLTEWHRILSATGNRLSSGAWDRVKAKLERATQIVTASGNEKAAKILEKARDHFERAERSHAEGQAARAEVEMDLALKLAAKAVDIGRSGSR